MRKRGREGRRGDAGGFAGKRWAAKRFRGESYVCVWWEERGSPIALSPILTHPPLFPLSPIPPSLSLSFLSPFSFPHILIPYSFLSPFIYPSPCQPPSPYTLVSTVSLFLILTPCRPSFILPCLVSVFYYPVTLSACFVFSLPSVHPYAPIPVLILFHLILSSFSSP